MIEISLSGVLSAGRWAIFISGAGWVLIGIFAGINEYLAYRRRVTVPARCVYVTKNNDGTVRHLLDRRPVAGEVKNVSLTTKHAIAKVGGKLEITYDPKHPHLIYLAGHYPRYKHWQLMAFVSGMGADASLLWSLAMGRPLAPGDGDSRCSPITWS